MLNFGVYRFSSRFDVDAYSKTMENRYNISEYCKYQNTHVPTADDLSLYSFVCTFWGPLWNTYRSIYIDLVMI